MKKTPITHAEEARLMGEDCAEGCEKAIGIMARLRRERDRAARRAKKAEAEVAKLRAALRHCQARDCDGCPLLGNDGHCTEARPGREEG